ncbi:MAG: GNAT family N-acetyltransferase [Casimicrobium sp.]
MKAEQQLIELATRADACAIANLSRDVIEQGLGWSWTAPRVLKALRDDSTNVIVARQHRLLRDIAGFAIMKYGDDTAHIVLFAVDAAYRRNGIGSALMAWLETTARTAGINAIALEARSGNTEARAFYQQLGFNEVGVRVSYYRGVEDAVKFEKSLIAE